MKKKIVTVIMSLISTTIPTTVNASIYQGWGYASVENGGNMWDIANEYGTTVEALAEMNGIDLNNYMLNPGDTLFVGYGWTQETTPYQYEQNYTPSYDYNNYYNNQQYDYSYQSYDTTQYYTYEQPVVIQETYTTETPYYYEEPTYTTEYYSGSIIGSDTRCIGYTGNAYINVMRACSLNNQIVIPAYGTYKASNYIGSGSYDMGFVDAPGLLSDGSTPMMPGSGICPVTTTIYNAGRDAGLLVDEANPHIGAICGYAPNPEDQAMYNFGTSDLIMRNPYDYDIVLTCSYDGGTVAASFSTR